MAQIDDLWLQLCAAPSDADLRQILADALLDAGDPRGELIQLQSLPHQTADIIARADDLIAAHWYSWLGVVADVLDRDATFFRYGFLDEITVRASTVELSRVRANRELHTVRAVRPGYSSTADFIRFVAELPYEPVMLELREPPPRQRRSTRGVCVRFWRTVLDLAPSFPDLEQLELSPLTGWDPRPAANLVAELPAAFSNLTSIIIDCRIPYFWYPAGDSYAGEQLLADLAKHPLVTIRR
jgi:hypothetical protein